MTDDNPPTPEVKDSTEQSEIKNASASWVSAAFRLLGWPFRMLFRVLIILITVFAITMFTGFVVIVTSLVIEIFLSIFDLIFRLELADDLNSWAQRLYEYWLGLIQQIATDVWSRLWRGLTVPDGLLYLSSSAKKFLNSAPN